MGYSKFMAEGSRSPEGKSGFIKKIAAVLGIGGLAAMTATQPQQSLETPQPPTPITRPDATATPITAVVDGRKYNDEPRENGGLSDAQIMQAQATHRAQPTPTLTTETLVDRGGNLTPPAAPKP